MYVPVEGAKSDPVVFGPRVTESGCEPPSAYTPVGNNSPVRIFLTGVRLMYIVGIDNWTNKLVLLRVVLAGVGIRVENCISHCAGIHDVIPFGVP